MSAHATKPRARVALGVTIPLVGSYGSVRVDAMFEDYERPRDIVRGGEAPTVHLRRRVAKTALADLTKQVKAALRRYDLDDTGKPKGKVTRWL